MKTAKLILSVIFSMIITFIVAYTIGAPQIAPYLFAATVLLSFILIPGKHAYLVCGAITAGNTPACAAPLVGGVNETMLLMNFGEIASYTENGTTYVIEDITMSSGKQAWAFVGQLLSNEPKYSLIPKRYNNLYKHEIKFLAFDVSPAAKLNLEKMAMGRMVAVVQYNYNNVAGDAAYDVYGKLAGMYVTALERNPNDPDNQGAIVITLSSKDESLEPRMPETFFKTTYAATKVLVDALTTPAP